MAYRQQVEPIVAAYVFGFILIYAHGFIAWLLWREKFGDPITMMASTGHPPKGSPIWFHVVSWPLAKLKYFGLIAIAGGVYGTAEWIYEHLTGKVF